MFETYPYLALALALAFLAHGHALPNTSSSSTAIPTSPVSLTPTLIGIGRSDPMSLSRSLLARPLPKSVLAVLLPQGGGLTATATNSTSPAKSHSAVSPSPDAADPATLLLCQNTVCGGCLGFDLNAAPPDQCLVPSYSQSTFPFNSVAISQPSDSGLPFGVLVSPGGCTKFSYIPTVNTCYGVPSGPFTEFAINDGN